MGAIGNIISYKQVLENVGPWWGLFEPSAATFSTKRKRPAVGCYIFNCPKKICPYKSENCDIKTLGGNYGKKKHLGIV